MTIEYKDSKRIVGLSTDITNTPTYEDDFSSDNKTGQANSSGVFTVDTGDERIEGTINRSGTNRNLTWDLQTIMGESIDSTAFVLTFKLQILTNSNTTNTSGGTFVALTSLDQNYGSQSGQDSVSIQFANNGSGGRISGNAVNGGVLDSNGDYGDQGVIAQLKTFYVKFAKDGDTTTITIAYDEGFTDLYHTVTNTTSGITGLRYFKIQNYTVAVSTYDGTTTFAVDDLKVYNGVTSLSSKPTNVQDNSLLVQKDTARRYWFNTTKLVFEDDFSSYASQSAADAVYPNNGNTSVGQVNITNDVIDATGNVSTVAGVVRDIGAVGSTFVLRFKIVITTASQYTSGSESGKLNIGLFSTNEDGRSAEELIALDVNAFDNNYRFKAGGSVTADDGGSTGAGGYTTETRYVEIKRLTDGDCVLSIFTSDAYTSSVLEGSKTSTPTGTITSALKYFGVKSGNSGSGDGTVVLTIDDISFWNNTTVPFNATWINEFGVSDGLMFGGVSTSSYANFSDSQSWNGVSWTAGGSLTGERQRGASAGTGSTSARYVNGYNASPAPYPNSNRNESYNGTAWTSDTVHPDSVNNKTNGGCGTVDSMLVTGGHKNGTGDLSNYYKWTGSWTSIAQGITGSNGSISGTLTSALMTKGTSAQTWNGSSWTSSTATSTSRTNSPSSGTSSTSGFRVFGTYANPFISTSESWNGTSWLARGSAPAGRVESGCIPVSTDSMMTLGGQQYYGASGSALYSTDVYEYRKGTFTTGASFNNGRRASGGAGS